MDQLTQRDYPVATTFGVAAPDGFVITGFEPSDNPYVPAKINYRFRKDVLRDALAFLMVPAGDGLYQTGPTGCGKTSLVEQIAARLHWPLVSTTGHSQWECEDSFGHHTLVNGKMEFVYGPLALAYKYGYLFMLNEIDLIDPSQLAGLNGVLDGAPLVIARNGGEVIPRHPNFRFIATGNSAGEGDQTSAYVGVQVQNIAFLDRFRVLEVSYPDEKDEIALVKSVVAGLPDAIAKQMVDLANHVRSVFISGQSNLTLSTRTLVRWANLTVAYRGAPNPLKHALQIALLNRATRDDREAVERMCQAIFSDAWSDTGRPSN